MLSSNRKFNPLTEYCFSFEPGSPAGLSRKTGVGWCAGKPHTCPSPSRLLGPGLLSLPLTGMQFKGCPSFLEEDRGRTGCGECFCLTSEPSLPIEILLAFAISCSSLGHSHSERKCPGSVRALRFQPVILEHRSKGVAF